MYSRAHLLIQKEFENLQSQQPWGIEALPLKENNVFEWVAKITGLKDTLWEGGVFTVYIKFDEHYNIRPPQICFHTIPFHPNIGMVTGKPCIDFLDDYEKWQANYSITMVLIAIQSLLSNPSSTDAVNMEAVAMMTHSPHAYAQMVQECVAASQRVNAGLQPQKSESKVTFSAPDPAESRQAHTGMVSHRVTKLSFDDYYTTWCGIATSKSRETSSNPLLVTLENKPLLQRVHMGLPAEEIREHLQKQIEEHTSIMHGRFKSKSTVEDEKTAKLNRLEKMKRIYLPPKPTPAPPSDIVLDSSGIPTLTSKDEPWEKEVDDLVEWTANLDATAIDA